VAMRAHADELREASWQARIWAAIFLGAVLGMPLLLDKQLLKTGRKVFGKAGGAEQGAVFKCSAVPELLVHGFGRHVGWAMMVVGCSPLFFHYGFGVWDALQLGLWPVYTPLLPWGNALMAELSPPHYMRLIICSFALLNFSIAATSVYVLFDIATGEQLQQKLPMATLWLWFALVNGYMGVICTGKIVRKDTPPRVFHYLFWHFGRFVCGSSGVLLMGVPLADTTYSAQHPYSVGTMLTAVSWTAFGVVCTPCNRNLVFGPWGAADASIGEPTYAVSRSGS